MAAPTRMAMIVVLNRGAFMVRLAQLPSGFISSCLNCIFNYVDIKIYKYNNYHFHIQNLIYKCLNLTQLKLHNMRLINLYAVTEKFCAEQDWAGPLLPLQFKLKWCSHLSNSVIYLSFGFVNKFNNRSSVQCVHIVMHRNHHSNINGLSKFNRFINAKIGFQF